MGSTDNPWVSCDRSGICKAFLVLPGSKIITLSQAYLGRLKIQVEEENKPPTTVYLNISADSICILDRILSVMKEGFVKWWWTDFV